MFPRAKGHFDLQEVGVMAAVNYIIEHEAFIEYAQDNGLSAPEQLLWYALVHIFNKRAQGGQWPDGFIRVTNKSLLSYLPIGEDAMAAARNRLKQRGLIDYVPGRKKAEIPMYRMNWFSVPPAEADPVDDPVFYPFKTGKGQGKPTGKTQGKTPDILSKPDIDVTPSDDDDDKNDDSAREERRRDLTEELVEAWCDEYGPEPTPAEARRVVQAAMLLNSPPEMVKKAVELSARNGARTPSAYIVELLKTWHDEEILTPEEYDEEQLHRVYHDRTAEERIRDREARRRKHAEAGPWQ